MGKISKHVIRAKNAGNLATWYQNVFGMTVSHDKTTDTWSASYPGPGVTLVFQEAEAGSRSYEASRDSCYWKIGVCVADVDLARQRVISKGTPVTEAAQFEDVGYLCHLRDPNGFTIELLQHTFEKNFVAPTPDDSLALGQPAVIGQITIRSTDTEKSLSLYRDQLGMKLLSIQDISNYGFVLYFFGFTDEEPPSSNLHDVSIREWLWQRPYTTLEIQVKTNRAPFAPMPADGEDIDHVVMEVDDDKMAGLAEKLGQNGELTDNDGVKLRIVKQN